MVIKNERSKNKLSFLLAIISSAFFQIFVLIGLGILQFMFWFLLGGILYNIMGSSELVQTVPLIVSYIIIFIMYAVIWYFYWKHLYFDEIKWFKYRVFFSIIPLIIELVLFNPTNDPTAMINIPPEPMFSSLVTAIILLPIYSVLIYKFIFNEYFNRRKKMALLCLGMIVLGSIVFAISYNMMHFIYK